MLGNKECSFICHSCLHCVYECLQSCCSLLEGVGKNWKQAEDRFICCWTHFEIWTVIVFIHVRQPHWTQRDLIPNTATILFGVSNWDYNTKRCANAGLSKFFSTSATLYMLHILTGQNQFYEWNVNAQFFYLSLFCNRQDMIVNKKNCDNYSAMLEHCFTYYIIEMIYNKEKCQTLANALIKKVAVVQIKFCGSLEMAPVDLYIKCSCIG